MAVRLIPCRHKTTGNTADLPESALSAGLFPRWIPIEESGDDAAEAAPPTPTRPPKPSKSALHSPEPSAD